VRFKELNETIDGCKVRVMRSGEGEPLVFLHGGGASSEWLPFMERLSEKFDVIAPEHPGFGKSDSADWLDNIGDLAYFYLDFFDHFDLDGVHLIGNSLGGWTALELAVRNQTSLKSLTLTAPAGIDLPDVPKGDVFLWSPEQTVRGLFHSSELAEAILSRPMPEDEQDRAMKSAVTGARLVWQPPLYNPHLAKWLHRITVPTLIVWGDDDKLIPAAYGPALQKMIPGSKLEVIKECGHVPQIECEKEFVNIVTGFIEGIAK
jgi:pimeloyl-ACP methyl ester carboxylesterase